VNRDFCLILKKKKKERSRTIFTFITCKGKMVGGRSGSYSFEEKNLSSLAERDLGDVPK
jgi:hypothetical protein